MEILCHVYVKNHENGSPWKVWCVPGSDSGPRVVIFGGYGKTLQTRELDITNAEMSKRILDKVKEGYLYQGEFMVGKTVGEQVNKPTNQATQKLKAEDLVFWESKVPPAQGWEKEVVNTLSTVMRIEVEKDGEETRVISSDAEFEIKVKADGSSRGRITKSKTDALSFLMLLVAAKVGQTFGIVDNDGTKISISRFREDMKHLKFDSMSFQDFEQKLRDVGYIRTNHGANLSGASSFF